MNSNRTSAISNATNDEAIGFFWDGHDFTEFDDSNAPDVEFELTEAQQTRKAKLLAALSKVALFYGVFAVAGPRPATAWLGCR